MLTLVHHLAGISVVSSPWEDQGPGGERARLQGGRARRPAFILLPAWPPPQLRPHSASVAAWGLLPLNRDRNRRDRPSEVSAPLPALVQPGGLTSCKIRGAYPGLGATPSQVGSSARGPKQNTTAPSSCLGVFRSRSPRSEVVCKQTWESAGRGQSDQLARDTQHQHQALYTQCPKASGGDGDGA